MSLHPQNRCRNSLESLSSYAFSLGVSSWRPGPIPYQNPYNAPNYTYYACRVIPLPLYGGIVPSWGHPPTGIWGFISPHWYFPHSSTSLHCQNTLTGQQRCPGATTHSLAISIFYMNIIWFNYGKYLCPGPDLWSYSHISKSTSDIPPRPPMNWKWWGAVKPPVLSPKTQLWYTHVILLISTTIYSPPIIPPVILWLMVQLHCPAETWPFLPV